MCVFSNKLSVLFVCLACLTSHCFHLQSSLWFTSTQSLLLFYIFVMFKVGKEIFFTSHLASQLSCQTSSIVQGFVFSKSFYFYDSSKFISFHSNSRRSRFQSSQNTQKQQWEQLHSEQAFFAVRCNLQCQVIVFC